MPNGDAICRLCVKLQAVTAFVLSVAGSPESSTSRYKDYPRFGPHASNYRPGKVRISGFAAEMLSLSLRTPDPVFPSLDMTSSFFQPEASASLFVSWAYACQSHKTINSRNELQDMFVLSASAHVDTTVWLLLP
jgi:hypothetical protein